MIIAKYKFDKSIYENLIPIFNDGYNGYTITDEIDGTNSNHIIRTIECDVLPTMMRFGRAWASGESITNSRTDSLLEILDMNTSGLTNCHSMFRYNTNLTSINCNWDTSNVTNIRNMFTNCNNLTSLDVSNFNTSQVTDMGYMFTNCNNLTSLNLSNFNTSQVTDMSYMFNGCTNLTSLNVSKWDTSNVTDMSNMFAYCYNLTSLDVSNWNTSNVTNMNAMINNCCSLTSLDVSNWDTSNVTNMQAMFADSYLLSSLDMSNWSDNRLNTAQSMFDRCNLHSLLINNFNIFKTVTTYSSFNGSTVKKLYVNDKDIIQASVDYLPSRVGEEPGYIVTALRDQIDDETKTALATKNWEIVDLVAQYRYDANTYEDLIPEFNTEFSSDKYEITDFVSDIVIDDMEWEVGSINADSGANYDNITNRVRCVGYYSILPNTTYKCVNYGANIFWYDESKKFISHIFKDTNSLEVSPANAKYMRVYTDRVVDNFGISAKLITRSIESVNGDLPTLMRFGRVWVSGEPATDNRTDSLLEILDMNTSELTSCNSMFRHNTNLVSISCEWDTSNVTDMLSMFNTCTNLVSLDVGNWNTSNVTNMRSTFYNCQSLTSLDVSNFNTNNVTDIGGMFYNCQSLTSLDVSNFNTNNVTNMQHTFYNCQSLTSLDVSNFNTNNVTTMQNMFYNCTKLTSLDVSNFNTSEVTSMTGMFQNCKSLISLDVSNWVTSKVTNMASMFKDCNNLTSLDVSNFDTSNVTDMGGMFYECNNLTSLDVSNWDTSKVKSMYRMFRECQALSNLDLSRWNLSASIGDLFINANSLKSIRMSNFKQTNQGIYVWYSCNTLEYIDINKMNITQVYEGMFGSQSIKCIRCNVETSIPFIAEMILDRTNLEQGKIITSVEVSSETISTLASKNWTVVSDNTLTKVAEYVYDSNTWNSMIPEFNSEFIDYFIDDIEDENGLVTRTISSMGGLPTQFIFGKPWEVDKNNIANKRSRCLLKILYLNITNRIISMGNMFKLCEKLKYINCDNWDTSNVTNTANMFFQCYSLTSLDVSNWDTSNVTIMEYMFNSCTSLTSLDLSNFNTSKVTSMYAMFSNCHKLTSLDVSNWDTSKVTNNNMFYNIPKLSDIGMLYCTPSTINAIASNLPTTHTQTIWVKDTKPNECTVVSGVEFKEYKENSVMINLSSPLLQGDRIEVVDGKLCHYHKMGKVVLDGSENWIMHGFSYNQDILYRFYVVINNMANGYKKVISDEFRVNNSIEFSFVNIESINSHPNEKSFNIWILKTRLGVSTSTSQNTANFKQWLQNNPITVIYELANPYYEDITPIQSNLTLETYLESNLDIYTDLPIKTNLTYLTNITNTSSIEEEINAINEGTDLTNLLEDEINN